MDYNRFFIFLIHKSMFPYVKHSKRWKHSKHFPLDIIPRIRIKTRTPIIIEAKPKGKFLIIKFAPDS